MIIHLSRWWFIFLGKNPQPLYCSIFCQVCWKNFFHLSFQTMLRGVTILIIMFSNKFNILISLGTGLAKALICAFREIICFFNVSAVTDIVACSQFSKQLKVPRTAYHYLFSSNEWTQDIEWIFSNTCFLRSWSRIVSK